jgi:phosphopentomutase
MTHSVHVENSPAACEATIERLSGQQHGLVFTNLIDFDMRFGHRRDPTGYARALSEADAFLARLVEGLQRDDLLIVTADHGNDPTFRGTDHTREYVPLLVYRPGSPGRSLGIREGFFDITRSLTDWFGVNAWHRGKSFLSHG